MKLCTRTLVTCALVAGSFALSACGGAGGGTSAQDQATSRSAAEVTSDVGCPQFSASTSEEVAITEGAVACVSLVFRFDGNYGQYIAGDFSGQTAGYSDIVPTGEGCSDHSIREPLRLSLDIGPCSAALVELGGSKVTPLLLDAGLLRYSVLRVRKNDDYSITPAGLYSDLPYTLVPDAFETSSTGEDHDDETEGERVVVRNVDPPLREDQVVGIRLFVVPTPVLEYVTDTTQRERITDVCQKRRECELAKRFGVGEATPAPAAPTSP